MRTDAVVIAVHPLREHDAQILCYSRQSGRIVAIARGMRTPRSTQAMHLDQLNLVSFELVYGRGIPIITAAQTEQFWPATKRTPARFAAASFFCEVIRTMVMDQERDDRLWEFLTGTLGEFERTVLDDILTVFRRRQMELLDILGYAPQLASCALCGGSGSGGWSFSVPLASVICRFCTGQVVTETTLSDQDILFFTGQAPEAPCARRSGTSVLDGLFEYIAQRRFVSPPTLYSALSSGL